MLSNNTIINTKTTFDVGERWLKKIMTTIDQRLQKDLEDILLHGNIRSAMCLEKEFKVSLECIPNYSWGARDADTVIVHLNPGGDPDNYASKRRFTLERIYWKDNLQGFIKYVDTFSKNFGKIDYNHLGAFDLKQAAFLEPWKNSGIQKVNGLQFNNIHDKNKSEEDKDIKLLKEAKRNVLMQKLQLELLPYPSKSFTGVKKNNVELLFPYLESVLEEIFTKKRKYVIFASRVFDTILRRYKDDKVYNQFEITLCAELVPNYKLLKKDRNLSEIKFSCTPVEIKYGNKKQKAIIANTFPNRGLATAYGLMNQYGKLCYDVFVDFEKKGICPTDNNICKLRSSKPNNK